MSKASLTRARLAGGPCPEARTRASSRRIGVAQLETLHNRAAARLRRCQAGLYAHHQRAAVRHGSCRVLLQFPASWTNDLLPPIPSVMIHALDSDLEADEAMPKQNGRSRMVVASARPPLRTRGAPARKPPSKSSKPTLQPTATTGRGYLIGTGLAQRRHGPAGASLMDWMFCIPRSETATLHQHCGASPCIETYSFLIPL